MLEPGMPIGDGLRAALMDRKKLIGSLTTYVIIAASP